MEWFGKWIASYNTSHPKRKWNRLHLQPTDHLQYKNVEYVTVWTNSINMKHRMADFFWDVTPSWKDNSPVDLTQQHWSVKYSICIAIYKHLVWTSYYADQKHRKLFVSTILNNMHTLLQAFSWRNYSRELEGW